MTQPTVTASAEAGTDSGPMVRVSSTVRAAATLSDPAWGIAADSSATPGGIRLAATSRPAIGATLRSVRAITSEDVPSR